MIRMLPISAVAATTTTSLIIAVIVTTTTTTTTTTSALVMDATDVTMETNGINNISIIIVVHRIRYNKNEITTPILGDPIKRQ